MKRIIPIFFILFSCYFVYCQEPPAYFIIDYKRLCDKDSIGQLFFFRTQIYGDTFINKQDLFEIDYPPLNIYSISQNRLIVDSAATNVAEQYKSYKDIPKEYISFDLRGTETIVNGIRPINYWADKHRKFVYTLLQIDPSEATIRKYIIGKGKGFLPELYNIVALVIWHRLLEKEMVIYVRCDRDFSYGDEIKLQNLYFREGRYFYDMFQTCSDSDFLEKEHYCDLDVHESHRYHYSPKIDMSNIAQHEITEEKLAELFQKIAFKIDLTNFENETEDIEKTFDFQTWTYKKRKPIPNSNTKKSIMQRIKQYMYTFVEGRSKGYMVLLKIIHNPSKEEMNVFMTIDRDIKYGNEILLTGMNFIEGCFFYDGMEYYNDWKFPHTIATIDLSNIKEHEISCNKFTQIEYSPSNSE